MTNIYTEIVKPMSTDELLVMTVELNKYQSTLVDAAKQELMFRGVDLNKLDKNQIKSVESTLNRNKKKEIHSTASEQSDHKTISLSPKAPQVRNNSTQHKLRKLNDSNSLTNQEYCTNSNLPKLYSKDLILILTTLSSVLLGGILFSLNLNTLRKGKMILPILIFSITSSVLLTFFLTLFGTKFYLILSPPINFLGGLIFYKILWKRYIGDNFQYVSKSIIKILLTILFFSLTIIIFAVLTWFWAFSHI